MKPKTKAAVTPRRQAIKPIPKTAGFYDHKRREKRDVDPLGMELAPKYKPALLGLNDLSGLKLANFNPVEAYNTAKFTSKEDQNLSRENGLWLSVIYHFLPQIYYYYLDLHT